MTHMTDTAIAAHVRSFIERGGDVEAIVDAIEDAAPAAEEEAWSVETLTERQMARLWRAGVTLDEAASYHGTDDNAWLAPDEAVETMVDFYGC